MQNWLERVLAAQARYRQRPPGPGSSPLLLAVTDAGIGIAPEETARIFEEPYCAPNEGAFAKDRTGLGLSIVKAIVDAHRRRIKVHSQLGRGTQFELTLPIAAASRPEAETKRGAGD